MGSLDESHGPSKLKGMMDGIERIHTAGIIEQVAPGAAPLVHPPAQIHGRRLSAHLYFESNNLLYPAKRKKKTIYYCAVVIARSWKYRAKISSVDLI